MNFFHLPVFTYRTNPINVLLYFKRYLLNENALGFTIFINLSVDKMAEYWLISVPGEKTLQQSWDTLNNATMRNQVLSTNFKLAIPDLKVMWRQLIH